MALPDGTRLPVCRSSRCPSHCLPPSLTSCPLPLAIHSSASPWLPFRLLPRGTTMQGVGGTHLQERWAHTCAPGAAAHCCDAPLPTTYAAQPGDLPPWPS